MNKVRLLIYFACVITSFIINLGFVSTELLSYQAGFFGNSDNLMYYELKNNLWLEQSIAILLLIIGAGLGFQVFKRNRYYAIFFWGVIVLSIINTVGNVLYLKGVSTYVNFV